MTLAVVGCAVLVVDLHILGVGLTRQLVAALSVLLWTSVALMGRAGRGYELY